MKKGQAAPPRREGMTKLEEQRRAAGLTQAELAERAGIAKNTISNIEQGSRGMGLKTILAVSKALGVDPKNFL